MVTIEDIVNKCVYLTKKHGLGVEGARDLTKLALLVVEHCQDRLAAIKEEEAPRA